jgi:CPA2 family monovalent cation:H+ antiporter-2
MNIDTINSLSAEGQRSVYGNSSKKEILEAAGIRGANYLIITIPSLNAASETASLAARMNPQTRIFVRTRFLSSKTHLKQIGVAGIAFEEEEVAKALTSLLLDDLEQESLLAATSEMASQLFDKDRGQT